MKKKTLLLSPRAFFCAAPLTACGDSDVAEGSSKDSISEAKPETSTDETTNHTHSCSNERSSDAAKHLHESTYGHDTKIDDEGHTYGEWTVITDSTLTTKGEKVRTCSVCGYEDVEEIPLKTSYKVTWVNYDNTVLKTDEIVEGTLPEYDGDTPTKDLNDGYEYSFAGWDKEIGAATSDITYKAEYKKTLVFKYTINEDDTLTITKYNGAKNEVVIPSTIDGKTVTSIGSDAFWGCSSLTSVTIPDSVTSIGSSAFSDCSSLTSVAIPDSVTSIGWHAFSSCSRLQYNEYDDGYYLGNENNPYLWFIKPKSKNISSCIINDNCRFIFQNAFYDCISLISITIPESVTSIESCAFDNCSSLTSIKIPDSVTNIGLYAFSSCSRLKSVAIGKSVTSIGKEAFYKCSSLTSITIPDSVTSIGWSVFDSCRVLNTVYFKGTIEEWDNINIDSTNTKLMITTKYFYSESEPTDTTHNYWHNVDGEPTAW